MILARSYDATLSRTGMKKWISRDRSNHNKHILCDSLSVRATFSGLQQITEQGTSFGWRG